MYMRWAWVNDVCKYRTKEDRRVRRIAYFDNVKFLLITLIVIGHTIDISVVPDHSMARAAFAFIYSFHVPLFIFISGLFINRNKLTGEYATEKIIWFALLGFAAKLIPEIVPVACDGRDFRFSLLSDPGLAWFMFVTAEYYLSAFVLKNINPKIVLAASVVIGLFVGYDNTIGDFLYLSRFVVYFPFFWLGFMLNPQDLDEFTRRPNVKAIGAVIVVAFAILCVLRTDSVYRYRGLFTGRNSFEAVGAIEHCTWINRMIAYVITTCMGAGILAIVPHGHLPVISSAGKRTLQIYILQDTALSICIRLGVFAAILSLPGPGWLLVFPLGVAITLALSWSVLEKPFNMLARSLSRKKT